MYLLAYRLAESTLELEEVSTLKIETLLLSLGFSKNVEIKNFAEQVLPFFERSLKDFFQS